MVILALCGKETRHRFSTDCDARVTCPKCKQEMETNNES